LPASRWWTPSCAQAQPEESGRRLNPEGMDHTSVAIDADTGRGWHKAIKAGLPRKCSRPTALARKAEVRPTLHFVEGQHHVIHRNTQQRCHPKAPTRLALACGFGRSGARWYVLASFNWEGTMAEAKLAPNLPDWMLQHANRYLASGGRALLEFHSRHDGL